MFNFKNNWSEILAPELKEEYFIKLTSFLDEAYENRQIFPPRDDIFNALKYTDYQDVKVVILGQDPYHGINQGHGLAFSVLPNIKTPPSLRNIYKELNSEYGYEIPNNGYLISWATQGVLMINTVLTVESGKANSHKGKGWEKFTDEVISALNRRQKPVIFLLWGNNARSKTKLITNSQHFILEAPHPSPLSAYQGFFGCNHFKTTNEILTNLSETKINWQIQDI